MLHAACLPRLRAPTARSPSTGRCHSTPIARVIVSRYFDLPATILIVVDDGIPHEKDQPIAYELKGALSYRKCGA